MAGKNCAICGAPSGMYPLCPKCFKLRDQGKIQKCEECGKWYSDTKACDCKKANTITEKNHIKYCDICGAPSGIYPLCHQCLKLKEQGLVKKSKNQGFVEKCEVCGMWYNFDNPCDCRRSFFSKLFGKSRKEDPIEVPEFHMDCLICGEDAGEQHFCRKCYYKYKDHDTILQLQNCTTAKVIEKYVEGTIYISQDGHKTRSRQEVMIDDFFFTHNIRHVYEKELMIDKDRYGIDHITPDFYLPDKGIYLEHLGFQNNTQYQKENAFKKKIYEDMHKTVIYTYPDDLNNIGSRFEYILTYYQKGSANFFRES